MRRTVGLGVVLGWLGLAVLAATAVRWGLADGTLPRLSGTGPWVISRALGITAFVSLTCEVVFGLLSSTATADRLMGRPRAIDLHAWLSRVTLALVVAHALVLLLDAYAGFDLLDLIVPGVADTRTQALALGIVASYGALAIHVSSVLRKHLGASAWRRLHYGSFGVFVGAAVHGLAAGSDSGTTPMRVVYVVSLGLVAALTVVRVVQALGRRSRRESMGT